MSVDEKNKNKIFGFSINNTTAIILFYISLITIIKYFPRIYFEGSRFIDWVSHHTFIEIISNFESLQYYLVTISLLIIIEVIAFYILLKSLLVEKSIRKTEAISIKWFSFRLTKSSLSVLFIISILNILVSFFTLYLAIDNLNFYPSSIPMLFRIYSILNLIMSVTLIIIHIYTLIICRKNRKHFR